MAWHMHARMTTLYYRHMHTAGARIADRKIKKARICHMIQVQRAPKRDSWGTASSVPRLLFGSVK